MDMKRQSPWLDQAWPELGTSALAGPLTSGHVSAYYADAGHPEVAGDDVAWCAAFVGACLERAGIRCTRSLLARSYLDYGAVLAEPEVGCLAIFARGSNPQHGHVAFVVGSTAASLIVLGGNQGHSVSVAEMPRSQLLSLRWPGASVSVVDSATSAAPDQPAAFAAALKHVLEMEGGYTDDPYDPGGPTNLGITLADLAAFNHIDVTAGNQSSLRDRVRALTKADVAPIYEQRYWLPSHATALPAPLALFHFDTSVNHGLVAAAVMLQQALSVDADGDIGPLTLAAAAACDAASTVDTYAEIRRNRYRALPTFWRFGRGWLARVDATCASAHATSNLPPPSPPKRIPTMAPTSTLPNDAPISPSPNSPMPSPKWWGQSVTIWGTIVTTLATVLPVVGPLVGLNISADLIHQLGDGIIHVAQAAGGVIGILMTIYGRTRAIQPLVRRDFLLKL